MTANKTYTEKAKDREILNHLLNYIIEPNTNREDEFAAAIEQMSDGEITKDEFHDWIASFDIQAI